MNAQLHKKLILAIVLFFSCSVSFCQTKKIIYCFPGQGSDRRIFDSLTIDSSFTIRIIEYGTPDKNMSLKMFAKQLAEQIDTTQEFLLLGVSLGGMICTEIAELLMPEKTILISSAKNKNELPYRYMFQKKYPLYKIFPGSFLVAGAKTLQPIVEPDRKKNKNTFKLMLSAKKPLYMKRTIHMLVNWDRATNSKKIYQIHGNNDHTLPVKNIKSPDYIIANGSHMITLTRAKEISEIINKIVKEQKK